MKRMVKTCAALVALLGSVSLAQNKSQNQPKRQQVDREKMAEAHRKMSEMHEKIADCLASSRPLDECRQEMASGCSTMMDQAGMGMHGMMRGMGMMGGMIGGCPLLNNESTQQTRGTPPAETPSKK